MRSKPTTSGEAPKQKSILRLLAVPAWLSLVAVHGSFALAQSAAEEEVRPVAAPTRAAKDGVKDITFDNLKFEMAVGEEFVRDMLTEEIEALFETTVRIKGFIRPSFRQSGITKFVFVRDDQECCFGPGAALYDCILVELAKGKTTDFTVRPITIRGEIYFEQFTGPDGNTWAIYRMRNAVVE